MFDARLLDIRRLYGDVYVSQFEDGLLVPWRLLTMGEYIKYDHDITRLFIPLASLENEVFEKCVVDRDVVARLDTLPAGVVTVVVQNIWSHSGPSTIEQFSQDFDSVRAELKSGRPAIYHQCAQCIVTAFNYTMEEVFAFPYPTFLLRLAQAEAKMIETGMVEKPFEILQPKQPKLGKVAPVPKPRVDAKKIWEEQYNKSKNPPSKRSPILEALDQGKVPKIPYAADKEHADEMMLDSHEQNEKGEMREYIINEKTGSLKKQMLDDAQWLYKDVIDELAKRKK